MRICESAVSAFAVVVLQAFSASATAGEALRPETLLERFRPAIYFENVGPQGARVDYPLLFDADDSDVENNFLMPQMTAPQTCYGFVHEQRDCQGKICWVLQYHYYYPRNWSSASPPSGCFTHEHDWEWIFVVVGSFNGRPEAYCACYSAHTAGNPELFGRVGAVRLYPEVAGGSVWESLWDQVPDLAPRVSLGWEEHVEATALASGNAFDGSPWQPRATSAWTHYPLQSFTVAQGVCGDDSKFRYGDPDLAPLCIGRSSREECGDETNPPWLREGLGANSPLPTDFALPDDWDQNPSTELVANLPRREGLTVCPNPTLGELRVVLPTGAVAEQIDLLDLGGRRVKLLDDWEPGEDGSDIIIDVGHVPTGRFWLRVRLSNGEEEVGRVLVYH